MDSAGLRNVARISHGSIVDMFRACAVEEPHTRGYVFLENGEAEAATVTYGKLDQRSRAIALLLQESVSPGARALLVYPPGLDFVAAFLGCLYAGVIAVPAYPPHPARLARTLPRLCAIAKDAGVSVVLGTESIKAAWPALGQGAPELGQLPVLATDRVDIGRAGAWRKPSIGPGTIAFLQYTSGSTASPKGVMVSHGNLLQNLAYLDYCEGNDARSCGVSWLPVYHDMGLIEGVLLPAFGRYPAYLMAPMAFLQAPLRWLKAISRYGATNSGGPNFAFDLCVRKVTEDQRAELDLSSWRVAYNGSEPVRHATLTSFARAFAGCGFRAESCRPTYGLAEATLLVAASPRRSRPVVSRFSAAMLAKDRAVETREPVPGAIAMVPCGAPTLDTRVVIVDPGDRTQRTPGEVGEIWVSGPGVAQGYWQRPEETERVFNARLGSTGAGPFLRTGDLGFLWRGELYVTGRIKDTIIIRGRKLYPQDIEATVEKAHPAIRPGCSAAFAVADGDGERLGVAVEVQTGTKASTPELDAPDLRAVIDDVRQAIAEVHEVQACAVTLLPPGALPKTSSGKCQRFACRAGFEEGTLEVLAQWVQSPAGAGA